jgi:class 3 adenylate cyclase
MWTPASRFRPLVALLCGVWLIAFGLSLDDMLRRTAYPPVAIAPAESPESFPRIVGLKAGEMADRQGLRVGDRLLAVGTTDLRGAGYLRWVAAVTRYHGSGVELPLTLERGGQRIRLAYYPSSYARYWPRLPASLAYLACALVLLLRMRPSLLVRALVYCYLVAAAVLVCTFDGAPPETLFGLALQVIGGTLVAPLALRAYLLFPDGVETRAPWQRVMPWLFAPIGILDLSTYLGTPFPRAVGAAGTGLLALGLAIALVLVMLRSYRRTDAIGRRKLKWVGLGHYLAAVPLALLYAAVGGTPDASPLAAIAVSATIVMPVTMLIAVIGYNFLDVDRLWSSTTSISVLVFSGVALLLFVMPSVTRRLSESFGLHETVAELFVIALVSVVAFAGHGPLLERVERLLFAGRVQVEQGMMGLVQALSRTGSPDQLASVAADGLELLLEPGSIVIYARLEDVFSPVVVRGELAPPRFGHGSPLVAALEGHPGPLVRDDPSVGRLGGGQLTPFQRAVLDTLDVPLVAPVRRESRLLGFLCLGAKRSGDVFSSTDVALTALLADKIASELLRFDQSQLVEASRALQERLRQYVPSPLADRLEGEQGLEIGEAEVSVLFVDIRGYSRMVEHLDPQQVFSTVNRYTELVSSLIRENGGTVVEFNGDGMMAVFGAPTPLERKERHAVAAGTLIVERARTIRDSGASIEVGVGVATGLAYVGSIQAVDRMIWTALGNTTNLASRLQAMTRELGADMIIDEPTWRGSGEVASLFEPHPEVDVRGVSGRRSLYLFARTAQA